MRGRGLAKLREKSGFDKLEHRERIIVLIGIIFLLVFGFLQLIVGPYLEASDRLDTTIANREKDILELRLLQQEYRGLKAEAGGIRTKLAQRPPAFSLFSFLERQAGEAGVKEYIGYMRPSTSEGEGELIESLVEMKFQQISLEKLVDFLQLVESPENVVAIKRMSIQESGQEERQLEVIIQIATFITNG